jgi:hypothetical protein
MKALAVLTVTIAMACGVAAVSAAAPTVADLAVDCNDDGLVDISGRARYVGGTGVIDGTCLVVLATGATFELRGGELTGSGSLGISAGPNDGAGTTVRVVDTTIDVAGFLEMTPGANAGDPGVADNDATVIVQRSKFRAAGIILATSLDWPNGRTVVRNSELTATSGFITIEASRLAGADGVTDVLNSTVSAVGDVTVASGDDGRTTVRRSTITSSGGSIVVTTGAGGTCRTSANTPTLTCT